MSAPARFVYVVCRRAKVVGHRNVCDFACPLCGGCGFVREALR